MRITPKISVSPDANRNSIIPEDNRTEAGMVKQATIYPAKHLLDVTQHLAREGVHRVTRLR